MPIYSYVCESCNTQFELRYAIKDYERRPPCVCGGIGRQAFQVQIPRRISAASRMAMDAATHPGPQIIDCTFENSHTAIAITGPMNVNVTGSTFKGNRRVVENNGGQVRLTDCDISA